LDCGTAARGAKIGCRSNAASEQTKQGGQGMGTLAMNRRRFLETSGQAAAGAAVVGAVGGTTMLMAPDGAWAMTLESLSGSEAASLLQALRVLYPHDSLGDQYYAAVVEALDQDAKANPDAARMLKAGLAGLDQAYRLPFLDLSEGNQYRALEVVQDSEFFQTVRFKTIATLYNNPRVWQAFGYEGPAFDEGGYVERGFDDLGWLPDPPADASPPMDL
jgi:hypothetical protein